MQLVSKSAPNFSGSSDTRTTAFLTHLNDVALTLRQVDSGFSNSIGGKVSQQSTDGCEFPPPTV